MGEKLWTSTDITSIGGGGEIHQGSGHISAPQISATTITHAQFFVRDGEGKEHSVQLIDAPLPMRASHRVGIVWGQRKEGSYKPWIAALNVDTNQWVFVEKGIISLAEVPVAKQLAIPLVFLGSCATSIAVRSGLLFILGFLAAVTYFVVLLVRHHREKKALRLAASSLRPQLVELAGALPRA